MPFLCIALSLFLASTYVAAQPVADQCQVTNLNARDSKSLSQLQPLKPIPWLGVDSRAYGTHGNPYTQGVSIINILMAIGSHDPDDSVKEYKFSDPSRNLTILYFTNINGKSKYRHLATACRNLYDSMMTEGDFRPRKFEITFKDELIGKGYLAKNNSRPQSTASDGSSQSSKSSRSLPEDPSSLTDMDARSSINADDVSIQSPRSMDQDLSRRDDDFNITYAPVEPKMRLNVAVTNWLFLEAISRQLFLAPDFVVPRCYAIIGWKKWSLLIWGGYNTTELKSNNAAFLRFYQSLANWMYDQDSWYETEADLRVDFIKIGTIRVVHLNN